MARNKVVFCQTPIEGLSYVDIGREYAQFVEHLSTAAEYASACKRILERTYYSEDIGPYLAITNIPILFEPELKLDLRQLIESFSINKCLVIHQEGEIIGNQFFLLGDAHYSIDLEGLSFIEI